MIGIDTNILVRYLTSDDKEQFKLAETIIENYATEPGSIFINNIVICELIWVLNRGYKYKKDQIVFVLKNVLRAVEFKFENCNILWEALDEYEKKDLDFSDSLIARINESNKCIKTFTFDQGASLNNHFELLNSLDLNQINSMKNEG